MSVNSEITSALSSLGVPVRFQTYTGDADTYITFFNYLQQGEQYADDKEIVTGDYIQVDIWDKGDYTQLVKDVNEKMETAGFIKQRFYDLYENDLKIYHKVMRYYKEVTL